MKPNKKICVPLPDPRNDCHRIVFKAPVAQVSYLAQTIEAYDFIAVPRTVNREEGIVEALAAPDFAEDARRLAAALCEEVDGLSIIII